MPSRVIAIPPRSDQECMTFTPPACRWSMKWLRSLKRRRAEFPLTNSGSIRIAA
jgi:hypothetical protein